MIQTYDIECQYCGKTFQLAVDEQVMNDYLPRLNGVHEKLPNGNIKIWKPLGQVFKDVDQNTAYQLQYCICDECS